MRLLLSSLAMFFLANASNGKGADCMTSRNPDYVTDTKLHFVQNKGQIVDQYGNARKDIQYVLRPKGLNIFIGAGVIHYQFTRSDNSANSIGITNPKGLKIEQSSVVNAYRMDMILVGGNTDVSVIEQEPQLYYENHKLISSSELIKVNSFKRLVYKNIYDNIDWIVYLKDSILEYDFVINPGGRPSDIKLRYNGCTRIDIDNDGNIFVETPLGMIKESAPVAFLSDGSKVNSQFNKENNEISFKIDTSEEQVTIDPIISWATYYGGSIINFARSVTVNDAGDVYICGHTASFNNIATIGSYQQSLAGSYDGYIAKFTSSGYLLWGTYFGGEGDDHFSSIVCNSQGDIYACGQTLSNSGISTSNAHQTSLSGLADALLVKFNSAGDLLNSTYYGGLNNEFAAKVKCDANDNVFICGTTSSGENISTIGAQQMSQVGDSQAFLIKFDSSGLRQWGTYHGGSNIEQGYSLDIDWSGAIYLCGRATSSDYPTTPGVFQTVLPGGNSDGFLAKYHNEDGLLIWSTFCGDSADDVAMDVTCGTDNAIYLIGSSTGSNALSTIGAYQEMNGGGMDGYLEKFDSENGERIWGTYYGGEMEDVNTTVTCNDNGDIFIGGYTSSLSGIATLSSYQDVYGGSGWDGFFSKFDASGILQWGSYYGGTAVEDVNEIVCNGAAVYICGSTSSSNNISTGGAHQVTIGGAIDGFIAKFRDCPGSVIFALGDTMLCQGDSIELQGPLGEGVSYQWLYNGNLITGANDTTYIAINQGAYSLIVSDGICPADTSVNMQVIVNPLPVPVIQQAGDTLSTGVYTTYQWYLNGTSIPGADGQTYIALQDGDYSVIVTDINGCEGASSIYQYLDITIIPTSKSLSLFPNPNTGTFTLTCTIGAFEKEALIQVSDIMGRDIYLQSVALESGTLNAVINLPKEVVPGIYILRIVSGSGSISLPFILD